MEKITRKDFETWKAWTVSETGLRQAICLTHAFGDLSEYFFKPEVLSRAGFSPFLPKLSGELGTCGVLLVLPGVPESSVFRRAVVLPLQWRAGGTWDDFRLPSSLGELASRVRAIVSPEKTWTLHLAPEIRKFPDISDLKMEWDSAFLPLYGGLALANQGLLPNPAVFATGAWQKSLRPVTGLAEKMFAACECEATVFFYPENCSWEEIDRMKGLEFPSLKRQAIPSGENLFSVTRDYLSLLAREPDMSATEILLENYYLLLPREKQQDFYLRRLKEKIAERVRPDVKETDQGRTLVCWISGGNELIDLAVAVFQPSQVVLLATENFHSAGKVFQRIENSVPATLCRFSENLEITALKTAVRKKIAEVASGKPLLLDLTSGKVSMSLSLYDCGLTDSRYLYWNTDSSARNQPQPHTTKPTVWNIC